MTKIPPEEYICCEIMKEQFINNCEQHGIDCPDKVLLYREKTRTFLLEGRNATYIARYCPWCGKNFPTDLSDVYYDLLEKLGFDWISAPNTIPEKYKTAEWWKERNL
jgi:hypothetical protein